MSVISVNPVGAQTRFDRKLRLVVLSRLRLMKSRTSCRVLGKPSNSTFEFSKVSQADAAALTNFSEGSVLETGITAPVGGEGRPIRKADITSTKSVQTEEKSCKPSRPCPYEDVPVAFSTIIRL